MNYVLECLKKFKSLPDEIKDTVGSLEALRIIKDIEKKYRIDLKFVVILVAIGEIEIKDIPEYLNKKFNIDLGKAKKISTDLLDNIFSKIIETEGIDLVEDTNQIMNIFQSELVNKLSADIETQTMLNQSIFFSLSNDDGIKQEDLEKILLANKEKITHKHFILDGKPHAPSVGNWIRDFIKKHGTGMFDNVVLMDYITNSENGKKLDASERKLVAKLLLLYRNLKFFPESMKGVPVEKWEIIPIDRAENKDGKTRTISGPPRTDEEKKIDELKTEEQKYAKGGLEERAIEEEINQKKQIENLRIEANKYPAGSLERRAIEEEIRKLGN